MTIALGQHTAKATSSGAAGPVTTNAINTTASGSSFLIGAIANAGSPPSGLAVSDNKGNTYSLIGSTSTGFGGTSFGLWQKTNGTGGTGHTASVTWTGTALGAVFFIEVTGAVTASLVDQISSAQWNDDTSTPFTSNATATTTQASEMAVAFAITGSNSGTETLNWSANSYTQVDALTDANTITGGVAYKVLSATGTQQVSFTSSGAGTTECITMLVTLKAAAGSTNYTLTVAQASIPIVGETVNFKSTRNMVVGSASLPIVGETVNLNYVAAGATAYTLPVGTAMIPVLTAPVFADYAFGISFQSLPVVGETVNLTYTPSGATNYSLAITSRAIAIAGQTVLFAATAHNVLSVSSLRVGISGQTVWSPPAPVPQEVPAGRRIRNIYRVTIDGQVFEFRTLQEALKLLDQAKELAAKVAEDQEIWQQPKPPPVITVSSRELRKAASETKREIKATYEKAALHAELRMLFELSQRQEEDETLLFLM